MNNDRLAQIEISSLEDIQEYYSLSREKHHLEQKRMERELTSWEFERLMTLPQELRKAKEALMQITDQSVPKRRSSGYFNILINNDNSELLSKIYLTGVI